KRYDALKARVAELEAELAEEHRQNIRNLARAEKAEADLERANTRAESLSTSLDALNARHGECQARVAELESKKDRCVYPDCQEPMPRDRVGDETPSQGVHEREAD